MLIGLIVGGLLATACGQAAGDGVSTSPAVPVQISQWERQVDHLHDLIGGSPRERAAGELVFFHSSQDRFARCMRAHGIAYKALGYADEWRYRDSRGLGASVSLWLEPIDDPGMLVRIERAEAAAQRAAGDQQARANRRYAALDPAAKERWDATTKRCPQGGEDPEGWHPARYQTLKNEFDAFLMRGDAAAQPHAGNYAGCMRRAGFQADNASVLPDALLPSFPPSQAPIHGPGGPKFRAWAARVRSAMAADSRCRRAAFLAGWRALGSQIAAWQRSHAQAIAAQHRAWERYVQIAEHESGWNE